MQNSYSTSECFNRENKKDGFIASEFHTRDSNMESLDRRNLWNTANTAEKQNILLVIIVNYFVNKGNIPCFDHSRRRDLEEARQRES